MKILNFFSDYYRNSSVFLLISICLFLVAIFSFYILADEIVLEKETGFDDYIFNLFKNFIVHEHLNNSVAALTNFASPKLMMYLLPVLLILLFLFRQKRKALFFLISNGGVLILFSVFKLIFRRERPLSPLFLPEHGFSFPSGHATFSFVFYGALAYLVWLADLPKWLKYIFIAFLVLLSISVGISRIYLRVHFPSDVLAGFCLGYSWLFLVVYFFRRRFSFR